MDKITTQLHPNKYYHIFNRGVNGAKVFFENKNYDYFLKQYFKYTHPFVETYAYCLLNNHYHLLIRIRSEEEIINAIKKDIHKSPYWHVSNGFSSFLQSYTRAINKMYKRTGPLFESPYKRILVDNDDYLTRLIAYIHCNAQKHRIVKDFRDHPYSSYHQHMSAKEPLLATSSVINWFGGVEAFEDFHLEAKVILQKRLILE